MNPLKKINSKTAIFPAPLESPIGTPARLKCERAFSSESSAERLRRSGNDVKRPILLIFSFIFFLFLPANNVSALTCAVRAGACNAGETALLRMKATGNSHAGFVGSSAYNNLICCSETGQTVAINCAANSDVFLKLQQVANSHVQKKSFINYANNACISISSNPLWITTCGYDNNINCTNQVGAGYSCLAEISRDTNAHISSCGAANTYTTSVCCGYLPPTCALSASPVESARNVVGFTANIDLALTTVNATTATMDDGAAATPIFSFTPFLPNHTASVVYDPIPFPTTYSTTYSVDLVGPGGTVPNACSATVDLLPRCTISADKTEIAIGDNITLTYETWDAALGGIVTPNPPFSPFSWVTPIAAVDGTSSDLYIDYANPATYTMTVTAGNGKTNTCSVTVDPLTSCDLTSPTTSTTPIVDGDTANLTWISSDATSAVLTPPGVAVAVNGNMNVTPSVTTTYKLDVTGTGANFCTATVHVIPLVIPTCSLAADRTTLKVGEGAKLTWTATNAVSADIDYGVGNVTPVSSGEIFFYPTVAGTYSFTMTVTSTSSTTAACSTANITINPATGAPLVEVTKRVAGNIDQIMSNILGWALSVAGSLLLLIIIIGGVMYISSTGEENKITTAKKTITWAIIGAILILVAYVIYSTVYNLLGL